MYKIIDHTECMVVDLTKSEETAIKIARQWYATHLNSYIEIKEVGKLSGKKYPEEYPTQFYKNQRRSYK